MNIIDFRKLCVALCLLVMIGCSNSADHSEIGIFVDSPVDGLEYVINGRQGVTVKGYFEFFKGEVIAFSVGGIPIGNPVISKEIITPIDIGPPDNTFPDNRMVLNIARFLQSLDGDGVLSNGISISRVLREQIMELNILQINFNQSIEAFSQDEKVLKIFETFRALTPSWKQGNIYQVGNFVSQTTSTVTGSQRTFKVIQSIGKSTSGTTEPDWDKSDSDGYINDNDITWIEMERSLISEKDALSHLLSSIAENKLSKIVFINLGDGLTAGSQSGPNVIHQFTQEKGFVQSISDKLYDASDLTWNAPLISFDALSSQLSNSENLDFTNTRIDNTILPYNLGVCGITTKKFLNETTNDNELMNTLYEYNGSGNSQVSGSALGTSTQLTQIQAADYLASLHPDKLKLITLWIGMNDVFAPIVEDYGSRLTQNNFDTFINDSDSGHDIETFKNNLDSILLSLTNINQSYVFIANIPDLSHAGFLFSKRDIESLIRIPMGYGGDETGLRIIDDSIMGDNEYIGIKPFIDNIAEFLALEKDFSMTTIQQKITQVKETDEYYLSSTESEAISNHIKSINSYIKEISDSYSTVYLVDLYAYMQSYDIQLEVPGIENAVSVTTTFGGGFYSLDGYFPSDFGYMVIADQFIQAINNSKIGVAMDEVDDDYRISVWQTDTYRDNDQDAYMKGPEKKSLIDPLYLELADCDDENSDIFAAGTYSETKETCP